MVRPKKYRQVNFIPEVVYYKPRGIPLRFLEEVNISLDEFEAMRLCDCEHAGQEDAAAAMKISRQTLGRTLKKARDKISLALVGGMAIRIEISQEYDKEGKRTSRRIKMKRRMNKS